MDMAGQLASAFRVPLSRVALKRGAASRNQTFAVIEPGFFPEWVDDGAFR